MLVEKLTASLSLLYSFKFQQQFPILSYIIRHVFLDLMRQVSILMEKYSNITVILGHEGHQSNYIIC